MDFGAGHIDISYVREVLKGTPLQASYEERVYATAEPEKARVRRGRLVVDCAGRCRTEIQQDLDEGGPLHVAIIHEPTGRITFHDLGSRTSLGSFDTQTIAEAATACAVDTDTSAAGPANRCATAPRAPETRNLGSRAIEGFSCHGRLVIVEGGGTYERWESRELGLPLLAISREHDQEAVFRVYDIDRTEPDPALFQGG